MQRCLLKSARCANEAGNSEWRGLPPIATTFESRALNNNESRHKRVQDNLARYQCEARQTRVYGRNS